jgi:hypothetical protein
MSAVANRRQLTCDRCGDVVALRIFERTLADVKPDIRRLYVKDIEHGFRLDCDLDDHVAGLKSALRKERETNRRLMATGGMPDGVAALTAIGAMPKVGTTRATPDVRAGLLPRSRHGVR